MNYPITLNLQVMKDMSDFILLRNCMRVEMSGLKKLLWTWQLKMHKTMNLVIKTL